MSRPIRTLTAALAVATALTGTALTGTGLIASAQATPPSHSEANETPAASPPKPKKDYTQITEQRISREQRRTTKRRLVWKDSFDGPAGAPANPQIWTYEVGGHGWGNQELQRYTNSTENAALDGLGRLAITAREDTSGTQCWYGTCRYTSARLITLDKASAQYGRIEARMKLPAGQGVWPAFWMMGTNINTVGHPTCGEIDIMELVGNEPWRVWASVHGPGYTGLSSHYDLPAPSEFADDFHTFTLDWTSNSLTFSIDNVVYHQVTQADLNGNPWVFDQPFFLLLNLAVGGTWPGEPNAQTVFPATLLVDEVAVYR